MQESGLIEIISLIAISAIWGQYFVFPHLEFLRMPHGVSCGDWGLGGHNIICLLTQQVTFFVHISITDVSCNRIFKRDQLIIIFDSKEATLKTAAYPLNAQSQHLPFMCTPARFLITRNCDSLLRVFSGFSKSLCQNVE